MRKFSGFFCAIILLLSLIVLPQSAIAASSSFVTSTFESKSLKGEDFTGQNLQQAEFTKVNLQEANLMIATFGEQFSTELTLKMLVL